MRVPTEFELQQLVHLYDPVQAHEYYEKHKHLKGRRPGKGDQPQPQLAGFAAANARRQAGAKAKQRKELQDRIRSLSDRLQKLEALITKREHEAAREDRKSKAKKERAAKERDKPKTAAEKAKARRESEQYRKKHRQELKSKEKRREKSGGGGGSSDKQSSSKKHSLHELKSLATKVKGQIAVAKQKLAAL